MQRREVQGLADKVVESPEFRASFDAALETAHSELVATLEGDAPAGAVVTEGNTVSISLATVGLLQYIGPTIQLGLGVWLYGEPFGGARATGFALIWLALALYSAESGWRLRADAISRR